MFKNLTIRTWLSVTIAIYTLVLLALILVTLVGIHRRDVELEEMYSTDTITLVDLKACAERLLQARVALGDAETVRLLGNDTQPALAKVRKLLADNQTQLATILA